MKTLFPTARILPLAIAACCLSAGAMAAKEPGAPATARAAAAANEPANDASALATIRAINAHEIATAEIAMAKPVGKDVMRYATMMKQEHSTNDEQTRGLAQRAGIMPLKSPAVAQLERKSAEKRAALRAKGSQGFERAYLQAMVDDHAEALARIDGSLLPNVRNEQIATHLRLTREHVQHHFDEAKRLSTSLASTADNDD